MTASELIKQLGGGNAIQKRFGYARGAVYNWRRRGIPDRVLLDQPNWLAAMRGNAELVLPPPASASVDSAQAGAAEAVEPANGTCGNCGPSEHVTTVTGAARGVNGNGAARLPRCQGGQGIEQGPEQGPVQSPVQPSIKPGVQS